MNGARLWILREFAQVGVIYCRAAADTKDIR